MSWQKEYLAALEVRDSIEKANKSLYDSYTKLADRAATSKQAPANEPPQPDTKEGTPSNPSLGQPVATIRQDFVEAQRKRGELQKRLDTVIAELDQLRSKFKTESQRVNDLSTEKTVLLTKLRDRDEELRGKSKLLEDIHDETVSLTLQLNMAEAQREKLQKENKELVDRWMARMGKEADAMNVASRFS